MKKRIDDLSGKKFNRLTVIERAMVRGARESRWICLCDCGKYTITGKHALVFGTTKSCGCWTKDRLTTHGMSKTREYGSWHCMKQRCCSVDFKYYSYYGGRGIAFCHRWLSFENFLEDMGPCPTGHSLERIDNEDNYYPANCTWASKKRQQHNMRSNRNITYNGVTKCFAEWARDLGLNHSTLWYRLNKGLSIGEAASYSRHKKSNAPTYEHNGLVKTIAEWSVISGVSVSALHGRLKRGWSLQRAISVPGKR